MRYFKFLTADGCSKVVPDPGYSAPPPEYTLPLVFPVQIEGDDLNIARPFSLMATRTYQYHKTIDIADGDALVIYKERR